MKFQLPTLLACFAASALAGEPKSDDQTKIEFFERKIRPVLATHCYECHAADSKGVKGGLLLDTRQGLLKGGDSGPAIVPGDPDSSLLLEALRYEGYEMPPAQKLPDSVIADFEQWIRLGAPDPRDGKATTSTGIDFAKAREHWSFQPPQRHPAPAVQNREWIRRPLDAFVLATLERQSLAPNPEADKHTWLRRVSFDLIGLPPTIEETESFLNDDSPEAYSRVVERLLASPHYGERWSRLWLDVARYAEDQAHIVGNDTSLCYPNAYLYRDWVIDALNSDMPYDQFVRLQLAADLTAPEQVEHRPALGFIGLGPKYYRRGAPEVMADEWEDRVDAVGRGLLGLTIACARCHDHKYDPIPTTDYYALAGVFASTEMFNQPLDDKRETNNSGAAAKPEDACTSYGTRTSATFRSTFAATSTRRVPRFPADFRKRSPRTHASPRAAAARNLPSESSLVTIH